MLIWKDICRPVFIVALFTIAYSREQSKCPSMDKWIKKMWCDTTPHTHIYIYAHIYTCIT